MIIMQTPDGEHELSLRQYLEMKFAAEKEGLVWFKDCIDQSLLYTELLSVLDAMEENSAFGNSFASLAVQCYFGTDIWEYIASTISTEHWFELFESHPWISSAYPGDDEHILAYRKLVK